MHVLTGTSEHLVVREMIMEPIVDKREPKIYRICYDRLNDVVSLKAEKRKKYKIPTRIYGDHHGYKKRIIQAFDADNGSMGVLLTGKRGSGKSLLAEDLANHVLTVYKRPVLILDEQLPPRVVAQALSAIGPCMLYMDEFGKIIHDRDLRNAYLGLFSDTKFENVLFAITANSSSELSRYVINRPGRFLFRINFGDITYELAQDIMSDFDFPEDQKRYLEKYLEHTSLSIDMALSLIKTLQGTPTLNELIVFLKMLNVPNPTVSVPQTHAFFVVSELNHILPSHSDIDILINLSKTHKQPQDEVLKVLDMLRSNNLTSPAVIGDENGITIRSGFHGEIHFGMDQLLNYADNDVFIFAENGYMVVLEWVERTPEDYSDEGDDSRQYLRLKDSNHTGAFASR